MKNLLLADLERFTKKKRIWIFLVLLMLYNVGYTIFYIYQNIDTSFNLITANINATHLFQTVYIFLIFMTVYTDEFSSLTIVTVIGGGRSRKGVVISKFIYMVIATVVLYAVYSLFLLAFVKMSGKAVPLIEQKYLFTAILNYVLTTISAEAFASILIYLSGNVPFSILGLVVITFVGYAINEWVPSIPAIGNLHPERLWYSNIINSGQADIMLGNTSKGLCVMLLGTAVYVVIALTVVIVLFDKRELDF